MGEPDDGRAILLRGAEAYQRGEVAEALRIFEAAARAATGGLRTSALINAASMADELGEHVKALGWYREALAELPGDAVEKRVSALVNYSQALQHVGDLEEAQSALEQARTLLADGEEFGSLRVACLLSLCAVAFHRGRWTNTIELATESLDAAVRFAPQLAGHPLSNLAGAYFETGNRELAVDFARQALAAFESAGDPNGVAETQQNLATMLLRMDRHAEAEPLLRAGQEYFERAGLGHRAGIGLKTLGFLAEGRHDPDTARTYYERAHEYFRSSGAVLDAADVQVRLATIAYLSGHPNEGERLIAAAFTAYAERGLGLHCAQIDFWHAALLETIVAATPDPNLLAAATNLAVTSAVAIDAVRHTFPNGGQREQWNRTVADPALRLAFRFAYLSGNAPLLADLIETQCAGSTLNIVTPGRAAPARFPLDLLEPPPEPGEQTRPSRQRATESSADQRETGGDARGGRTVDSPLASEAPAESESARSGSDQTRDESAATPTAERTATSTQAAATEFAREPEDDGAFDGPTLMAGTAAVTADPRAGASALQLGAALAEVVASAGLAVSPPPRLAVGPDGHIALAGYIAAAEQRYGRKVRDDLVVTA